MKKLLTKAVFALCVPALLTTSCNSAGDDSDCSSYTDCAVTAVVLGTLKRTMTTTASDGSDSTYTTSVTGSLYPMYIDQLNNEIYNPDSLPINTKAAKVVFSTFKASGAGVTINALSTDGDTTFVTTDSTDFTSPRLVTAHAYDGVSKRVYTVRVNVHKEAADSFTWKRMGTASELTALTEQRALILNGQLYVFGKEGTTPVLLTAATDAPTTWTRTALSVSALAVRSVQLFNGVFYALDGTSVISSGDGLTWNATGASADALVGTSSQRLFALNGDYLYSTTDGATWTKDSLDTQGELPTAETSMAAQASATDKTYENVLLVGQKSGAARIWKRTIDLTGSETYTWVYYPETEDVRKPCPVLSHTTLLPYNGQSLYLGLNSAQTVQFYNSPDNGRTWLSTTYAAPAAATAVSTAAAVDGKYFVWLICGGSGEVWRGRLNQLGWAANQTVFVN